MKKFLLFLLLFIANIPLWAQTAAVKKVADAAFSLTTYRADGTVLATSNGVFVSKDGIGVSTWQPFVGADHAVIVDNKGTRHPVESILGINELYDVVKFKVNTTSVAPSIGTISTTEKSDLWIVGTSSIGQPVKTSVENVERFMDKYNYYVLGYQQDTQRNGSPLVNAKGQVVGLLHATGASQSGTDILFAKDLMITGLSQNDLALRQCGIRVAVPNQSEDAIVALMLSIDKPKDYRRSVINEFIAKFPKLNEGYFALAGDLITNDDLTGADKALKDAITNATNKEEAHYNYALLIYRTCVSPTQAERAKDAGWNLNKAMEEVQAAEKIKADNRYKHLQAQITFSQGEYQKAYEAFEALTKTDFKNPELFLEMAQSLQQLNGEDAAILALLDRSIEECDTPYVHTSAPFFYARGLQHDKMGNYRLAMKDFQVYEYFNQGLLTADFYFMRAKSESKGKLWQQALQDILIATRLTPKEPTYYAEAGSLLLRVNKYEAAISAANDALQLNPNFADAHLVKGIAQCMLKNKTEGLQNIKKAKELGNQQAEGFIEKFK